MSMPGIVLLIALYARTGPNIFAAMSVFGLLIALSFFRLVRSIVLGVRNELYVDAAKVVGLSDLRIVGRHVLRAVRAPVITQSAFVLVCVRLSGSTQDARTGWSAGRAISWRG